MKKKIAILVIAVVVFFTSCLDYSGKQPTLNYTELSMYPGEQTLLEYSWGGDCQWLSDNPRVADVSADGLVTANHVGYTTIYCNRLSCKVSVKPKVTIFKEPYLNFGCSIDDIKKNMIGYVKSESNSAITSCVSGKNAGTC